ncbi:hypothetical protein ACOI22_03350 [Glaciecola sp. 2405UD65-10]|uniref:hypothetical protein n=1 Tax=Glaciecola sp. 2405UD65-10 TaxID=3397244 RepID=UPI003B5CAE2D
MTTSMIAGTKLEYSVDEGTTFIEILGVPEVPEFREEKGEREVTTIRDTTRQYDEEMESPTEVTLTANYLKADSSQLAFRALASNGGACIIRATYSDGDIAEAPIKLKNYGINGGDAPSTKQWSCVMRRTGSITFTEATS